MGHHERNHGPTIDTDADAILRVTTQRLPTALVITAVGEIDLASADRLTTAVRAGLDGHPGTLVIDLSDVTFMSSVGLAALLEAQSTADRSRDLLHIVVDAEGLVARVIAASGLTDRLPLFRSLDEALAC